MEYKVVEVLTRKDLRKFVKFPDELYRNCPQYVPALHSDQINSLTKVSTLSYCTRKMWMVLDGKKVVGRICAMVNPRYNERYDKKRARFGWFDTIDDIEVAKLLISTAEAWAKSQGMTEIHGPLYYNTLGKQGMLVEGYENTPPFNCLYNFPYYVDFMDKLGFVKECDWLQYELPAFAGVPDKAIRVSKMVKERYNIKFGSADKLKHDPEMIRKFFKLYNDAFAPAVYNFIPFTDEEVMEEAKASLSFISDRTSSFLMDENDNVIGFAICFPSISEALKKAKGRLFPFGWYHLLKALRNYEVVDMMVNGVDPEWQSKGISSVYYCDLAEKAKKYNMVTSITNPQIETNSAVNVWSSYDSKLFMRRRCFVKEI